MTRRPKEIPPPILSGRLVFGNAEHIALRKECEPKKRKKKVDYAKLESDALVTYLIKEFGGREIFYASTQNNHF